MRRLLHGRFILHKIQGFLMPPSKVGIFRSGYGQIVVSLSLLSCYGPWLGLATDFNRIEFLDFETDFNRIVCLDSDSERVLFVPPLLKVLTLPGPNSLTCFLKLLGIFVPSFFAFRMSPWRFLYDGSGLISSENLFRASPSSCSVAKVHFRLELHWAALESIPTPLMDLDLNLVVPLIVLSNPEPGKSELVLVLVLLIHSKSLLAAQYLQAMAYGFASPPEGKCA